jgi:hypothetical protein
MSNFIVISIFAIITFALALWFTLRVDYEKEVREKTYDALQRANQKIQDFQLEIHRLGNENFVLMKQLEQLKKNSLVRDSKTGRFVKFGQ